MVIGLPTGHVLQWLNGPGVASFDQHELKMTAGERTDWFIDPGTGESSANAPVLCDLAVGDFQLVANVAVDFAATFDAGVLFVHDSSETYAKLCFELSPAGERTVVSVVTRSVSDDANGSAVDREDIWLRISRIGDALAFHWSVDGARWELSRYFQLKRGVPELSVGFCVQSPTGEGCAARFTSIDWTSSTLADVRDGS